MSVMVPADVIGPPVVERPVVPPDTATEVTVPEAAVTHEATVPLVPRTSPACPVCVGRSALIAFEAVVCPVPPFAMPRVPPMVSVPDAVIGPPANVRPVVPPEPDTDVTVPGVKPRAVVTSAERRVTAPVRELNDVTPPATPDEAAVMRPYASTVREVFV